MRRYILILMFIFVLVVPAHAVDFSKNEILNFDKLITGIDSGLAKMTQLLGNVLDSVQLTLAGDTQQVFIFDTTLIEIFDTTVIFDTVIIFDTTVVNNNVSTTAVITVNDTILNTNNFYNFDNFCRNSEWSGL